jgi:NAD(P)-dependent dehydrogenase (short-subunit alcohol dehydrogenase family)
MERELAGQVAVVTGASKGIGLAVVRGLAASGAQVVAGARETSDGLEELAKDGSVEIVLVDLTDPAGPAGLVARAGERIDVLINNSVGRRRGRDAVPGQQPRGEHHRRRLRD